MDARALERQGIAFAPSHGRKRTKAGRYAADVTLEELQRYFHVPTDQACKKLGVGLTILKRIARRYGIQRWPYCKPRKSQGPSKPSRSSSAQPQLHLAHQGSPTSSHPSPQGAPNPFAGHSPHAQHASAAQLAPAEGGLGLEGSRGQQAEPTGGPAATAAAATSWGRVSINSAGGNSVASAPTDCGAGRLVPSSPSSNTRGSNVRRTRSDPTPQSVMKELGAAPRSTQPPRIHSPARTASTEGKMGALLAAIEQSASPERGAVRHPAPVVMRQRAGQHPALHRTASSTLHHGQQEQEQQHGSPAAAAAAAAVAGTTAGVEAPVQPPSNPFLSPPGSCPAELQQVQQAATAALHRETAGALWKRASQAVPLLQQLAQMLVASPELTRQLVQAMGSIAPIMPSQQQKQLPRAGPYSAAATASASEFKELHRVLVSVAGGSQPSSSGRPQPVRWNWGQAANGWNKSQPPPAFTSQQSAPPRSFASATWQPRPLLHRSDSTPPMAPLLPGPLASAFHPYGSAPLGPGPHWDAPPSSPRWRQVSPQQQLPQQWAAQALPTRSAPADPNRPNCSWVEGERLSLLDMDASLSSKQSCNWPWSCSGALPSLPTAASSRAGQQPEPPAGEGPSTRPQQQPWQQEQKQQLDHGMRPPPAKKPCLWGDAVSGEGSGSPQQQAGMPSKPTLLTRIGGGGVPLHSFTSPFVSAPLPLQQAPSLLLPLPAAGPMLRPLGSQPLMPLSPLGANFDRPILPMASQAPLSSTFVPAAHPHHPARLGGPPHEHEQQERGLPTADVAAQAAVTEGMLRSANRTGLLTRLMQMVEDMQQQGQMDWPATNVQRQQSILRTLITVQQAQQARHATSQQQCAAGGQQRHHQQQQQQQLGLQLLQQQQQQQQLGPQLQQQQVMQSAEACARDSSGQLQSLVHARLAAWRAVHTVAMQQAQVQAQPFTVAATQREPSGAAAASNP